MQTKVELVRIVVLLILLQENYNRYKHLIVL